MIEIRSERQISLEYLFKNTPDFSCVFTCSQNNRQSPDASELNGVAKPDKNKLAIYQTYKKLRIAAE